MAHAAAVLVHRVALQLYNFLAKVAKQLLSLAAPYNVAGDSALQI
jgi:hypothetical protein